MRNRAASAAIAMVMGSMTLAATNVLIGQEPGLVVSADWLAATLDDDDLVVLQVGSDEDFSAGHIPGAQLVTREAMSAPRGEDPKALILELPDPTAFQSALRGWGVNGNSRIVVVFAGRQPGMATRLLFTLDWAGLGNRASFLDGGLIAWQAAGHPVSTETPVVSQGDVTVSPRDDLIVDSDWVASHGTADGRQIVDARGREFFDGERPDREGVTGHIPGASSVHWATLIDEETLLLHPPERLREVFAAAGVGEGDEVVGYCHIGMYATMMILGARSIGHDVVLYDGSFQDWAQRGLPTEGGY